jgi:threonine synthase
VSEIALQGATVYRVGGLIVAARSSRRWPRRRFDVSTLKEPRIEGKKTMGPSWPSVDWDVPDVILYPTGGGTGLIRYEGVHEPRRSGSSARNGRGCAVPRVAPRWCAMRRARSTRRAGENAHTIASGIRVPQAVGDFLILRAVRESGGFAIAVDDDAITAALAEAARVEGFLMCPEGAATYAAYKQGLADGRIRRDERAVLFNCATGLKYPLPPIHRTLDRHKPIDFAAL